MSAILPLPSNAVSSTSIFPPDQDLTGFGAVGRTDHPFTLHPFDHPGGPIIADPQAPLDHGDRGLTKFTDQGHRLVVAVVKILFRLPVAR